MNTQPNNGREAGLYDEQVFKVLVEYELSRAQRYPNPLTMLHISLNLGDTKPENAKSIRNIFSDILNTSLRISDIPAYYGEDFLVLMPSTDKVGAQAASSRLIARLKGTQSLANGKLSKFNIHIGIATHPGGRDTSVDKLLQQARAALQDAGRPARKDTKYFLDNPHWRQNALLSQTRRDSPQTPYPIQKAGWQALSRRSDGAGRLFVD